MTNEELAVRIKNGETELTMQLWERVLPKIKKCAYRYKDFGGQTNWVEMDDLILAMMDAVRQFKPQKEHEFEAYLKFPLIQRMRECIGDSKSQVTRKDTPCYKRIGSSCYVFHSTFTAEV